MAEISVHWSLICCLDRFIVLIFRIWDEFGALSFFVYILIVSGSLFLSFRSGMGINQSWYFDLHWMLRSSSKFGNTFIESPFAGFRWLAVSYFIIAFSSAPNISIHSSKCKYFKMLIRYLLLFFIFSFYLSSYHDLWYLGVIVQCKTFEISLMYCFLICFVRPECMTIMSVVGNEYANTLWESSSNCRKKPTQSSSRFVKTYFLPLRRFYK